MEENLNKEKRRGRSKRAERSNKKIEFSKYIERNIPNFEILNLEAIEIIEKNAEIILQEIGVKFVDNVPALKLWKNAGATVEGDLVKIPKGLARSLCKTAPSSFVQNARNPERSVKIGGNSLVFAPVYGPPFFRDSDGGRRYATLSDFENCLVR